jgi:hypothetical protein
MASRPSTRNLAVVLLGATALATAASGVTLAATSAHSAGYTACSTAKRVLVLRVHGRCPHGSHRVTLGRQGPAGHVPTLTVTNVSGVDLSSQTDETFHSVATLRIPAKGDYIVTSKVVAHSSGGSGTGDSICDLVALTTKSKAATTDESEVSLQNTATVGIAWQTQADQVSHDFSGPGTVNLSCQ